jgi:hypothetical protein
MGAVRGGGGLSAIISDLGDVQYKISKHLSIMLVSTRVSVQSAQERPYFPYGCN